ncbi:MAG: hypothetical protein HYX68_15225 [Planctomycetes bacterium]|nr:hypothetical protein [Planctomycetota bacterium]
MAHAWGVPENLLKFACFPGRFLFIGVLTHHKIGGGVKMAKARQIGPTRLVHGGLALTVCAGMLALTGCSTTSAVGAPQGPDPLVGVMAPPSVPLPNLGPAKNPAAEVPAETQSFQRDDIPKSTNPATLAGMSWTGPLGRPLAIDDNYSGPSFFPASNSRMHQSPEGFLPPNPKPKVEAVPDLNANQPKTTPIGAWQAPQNGPIQAPPSINPAASDAALSRQLQDRGVVNQKQTTVPEGLHLTCYISRGPQGGLRILEVTAADYATAAQAILRQLEAAR